MALSSGKTTVTTAGTRVVLAATASVNSGVVIKALHGNTGIIYVGNSTVASTNGLQLYANEAITVITASLANVYIDSSVNGEGVTWLAS